MNREEAKEILSKVDEAVQTLLNAKELTETERRKSWEELTTMLQTNMRARGFGSMIQQYNICLHVLDISISGSYNDFDGNSLPLTIDDGGSITGPVTDFAKLVVQRMLQKLPSNLSWLFSADGKKVVIGFRNKQHTR